MIWLHLIDFGLLVLIWAVQLLVYPSFKYLSSSALLRWHRTYTPAITVIVMPLMVSQVVLHVLRLYGDFSWAHGLLMVMVLSTWITTFIIFVPLHNTISSNDASPKTLDKLIAYNWVRTALWTVIFLAGVVADS
jgi:hypothetical protein